MYINKSIISRQNIDLQKKNNNNNKEQIKTK